MAGGACLKSCMVANSLGDEYAVNSSQMYGHILTSKCHVVACIPHRIMLFVGVHSVVGGRHSGIWNHTVLVWICDDQQCGVWRLQSVISGCKEVTWVTTLAGRRRPLLHIHEAGRKSAQAERQAVNTVCQVDRGHHVLRSTCLHDGIWARLWQALAQQPEAFL